MKLVSMKRTAEDKRKDMGEPAGIESIAPDYPWGLVLHLDKDEIDKLGFKDLPDVGTELPIQCVVKVTRVSQSATEGADEETCIDLQIIEMAVDTTGDNAKD